MDPEQTHSPAKKKEKRRPRKVSRSHLQNAALYYLQRFSSSSENLRRVLTRKVRRSAYHHATDEEEGLAWVDEIVERFLQSGLLDDTAYAESKVRALRERGNSNRQITAKLMTKGVPAWVIDTALASISDNDGTAEPEAAVRFAKRRRFGPFGDPDKKETGREKALAAMARAGFSYDLARQIIDASTETDLLESLKMQEI